jgi:molybdenum cofactor cytidylyltransferase
VKPRAVILAAGESKRMGTQKLLLSFCGRAMIDYAVDAARDWLPLIVASPAVAEYLAHRSEGTVLLNAEPHLGMSHSLLLADRVLHADIPLVVLLGDKPLVTHQLIASVCATAKDADVTYPVRGNEPGHPVFLSARARTRIALLPPGDTIGRLREDLDLVRTRMATDDRGAFFDVDTADVLRLERR